MAEINDFAARYNATAPIAEIYEQQIGPELVTPRPTSDLRVTQEPHYSKETRQLISMIEEARAEGYDSFVILQPTGNIGWMVRPLGIPRCLRRA